MSNPQNKTTPLKERVWRKQKSEYFNVTKSRSRGNILLGGKWERKFLPLRWLFKKHCPRTQISVGPSR